MLENLVRPGALELAREAVRRGIDVGGMCQHPTYNQRCYSCGKHHGWACVCSREEKADAWGRREAKMATPWYAGKWETGNILDGYKTATKPLRDNERFAKVRVPGVERVDYV